MELYHSRTIPTFDWGFQWSIQSFRYIRLTPINFVQIIFPIFYIHIHTYMPSVFVILLSYVSHTEWRCSNFHRKKCFHFSILICRASFYAHERHNKICVCCLTFYIDNTITGDLISSYFFTF